MKRKIFRKIHLWLSVPFGLIITIICLSGAILVFEQEITHYSRSNVYKIQEIKPKKNPIATLVEQATKLIPDTLSVTGITIWKDSSKAYQINLSKPRRASIMINQYTGELKGANERPPFFAIVFKIHRWLLDNGKKANGEISWGKLIVGISTLMFVFVLLSGLVMWIPRKGKTVIKRLKIVINKSQRRCWYGLHVSLGIYALIFLLVMSLTGLTWSFQWYRNGLYNLLGTEQKISGKNEEKNRNAVTDKNNCYIYWDTIYDQISKLQPNFTKMTISNQTVSVVNHRYGNLKAAEVYTFNPKTGEITEFIPYKNADKATKIKGWIYALHVGEWGGVISKIITCLAAIIGASLPLTGYYLWIKRLQRKNTIKLNE